MGTCVDIEVRPSSSLTPQDRAEYRDHFVREFEARFNDWSAIARVCCDVERDRDYLLLGFKSFHQWILAAAPKSRAYIYLVTGRYKELKDDFSDAELAEIDLDSTTTLRKLSPAVRRDPEVREAAKKKPRDLRKVVTEKHPEQLIEECDARVLNFPVSAAEVFDEALQCYRTMNNPSAPVEEFVEGLCADYLDAQWEEGPYSNRERAAQLRTLGE
jgi:hypothetical protein